MADEVKKIAQRIELTGEKEYNAALKDAQRNLRVLRSELKAETAELGKNATEQQKNEAKLKNLQKQIKEQEKVVKTYESALKEVREKYSDNEEAISKWEIKLNDARTALANMKNSLDDTGKSMKDMGASAQSSVEMGVVATNSLADSLGKIADAGGTVSSALEEAFKGIANKIKETVTQVWESVVDLAARSNSLVDLAGFWNTDVTNIQRWAGAVAEASADLQDLNNIVTKINAGDTKKIAELTGVSNANYKDQWEYAMAVMDAMSKMDKNKRNDVGFEIFGGRQATKAFDLLNDWQTVLDHLDKYDVSKGGYGLSDEQLQNMSELYDKVNGLQKSWSMLKDMATVELFGNLVMNITGNLQNIVDAFKEYFQAEDQESKKAALEKVKENIIEMFTQIKDAIVKGIEILSEVAEELKQSDDGTVKALGEALGGLVDALKWFTVENNWEMVRKGFEALIGIWATGKIVSALGNLASFASHIATIKSAGGLLNMIFGNNNTTTPTTTSPTPTTTTPAAAPETAAKATGTGIVKGFSGKLASFAGKLAIVDPSGSLALVPMVVADQTTFGQTIRNGGTVEEAAEASWETIKASASEGINNFVEYFTETLPDAFWSMFGFKGAQDAATKFLENHKAASEWTLDDHYSVDEIMELIAADEQRQQELEDTVQLFMDTFLAGQGNNPWDEVPGDWWTGGNQDGITSDDINGLRVLPGLMKKAVTDGVSGIKVTLDGRSVGNLVAPYVSEYIAQQVP